MIWIATMNDGTIIRQYENNIRIKDLDKNKIKNFRITESMGESSVPFNTYSGVIKFSNIDFKKQQEFNGSEELRLIYDTKLQTFRLDEKSLKFYNQIALKDEKDYFYIEIDENGIINAHGQTFKMGFIEDGKDIKFYEKPPFEELEYFVGCNEDVHTNNSGQYKRMSYDVSYQIIAKHKYEYFEVMHDLMFDRIKNDVRLKTIIVSEKNIIGTIYTISNGHRIANPIELSKNCPVQFSNTLCMF